MPDTSAPAGGAAIEATSQQAYDAAFQRIRTRILSTIHKLDGLDAIGSDPIALRFVIEMQSLTLDVLIDMLVSRGVITRESYDGMILGFATSRADLLEKRLQAALEGQQEMPT